MKRLSAWSFQAKLLGSFVLVVALALGVSQWLVSRALDQAFSEFSARSLGVQQRLYGQVVEAVSERLEDRAYVQRVFAGDAPADVAAWLGDLTLEAVQTAAGTVEHREIHIVTDVPLAVEEEPARVFVARLEEDVHPLEERFLGLVGQSIWLAGGAVGAIALLLGFGLLRQLTVPLRALDAGARQISRGELGQRVAVRGRDELGRLGRSFNEMAASLARAEAAKRQLIADVSHELRTPISVVRLGLEGLMDEVLEPTPENFAALHTKTLLVTRLVDDLQQLALADAGRLEIRRAPLALGPLLEHIRATIGVQFEDQDIALEIELPADLAQVHADAQRLEQVFLNLLSNAARHTPPGGRVRVRAANRGADGVEVECCDSGPGFAADDLPHVFDRFYRADRSRARASGGSGLGLAIVKALIEAHGGRIEAANRPEGGACFRFTLPTA